MSEWTTIRLGSVVRTNTTSYSPKEGWKYVNYLDTGNITENVIDAIQNIDLANEKLPSRAKRKVQINSILYSTVRPNQKHFGIIKSMPENFLVSTGFAVIDIIPDKIDADYLYFWLTQNTVVEQLHAIAEQSVSAYPSIKASDIENLEITLPPLTVQKSIASILKSISDKMSHNSNINENLQKQANLIFDELVGQHIPTMNDSNCSLQLHEIGNLDVLITDYVANGSFKSLADNVQYLSKETDNVLIRLTDYNNNFSSDMVYISDESYNFLSKSKLYGDEIIISNVGANVGTVFRCPRLNKRMSLAPNAIMLRSAKYEHYLYLYFISHYGQQQLQSIVTGSAQPKFNKTNFRSLKVVLPDETILNKITDMYNPMFEQIVANLRENKALVEIRDSLLPKLMSGELEVSGFQF